MCIGVALANVADSQWPLVLLTNAWFQAMTHPNLGSWHEDPNWQKRSLWKMGVLTLAKKGVPEKGVIAHGGFVMMNVMKGCGNNEGNELL